MANGRWLRMAVILPAHPLGNFFISPAFLYSEKNYSLIGYTIYLTKARYKKRGLNITNTFVNQPS